MITRLMSRNTSFVWEPDPRLPLLLLINRSSACYIGLTFILFAIAKEKYEWMMENYFRGHDLSGIGTQEPIIWKLNSLLESGHVCWSLVMSAGVWSCLAECLQSQAHEFMSHVPGVWSSAGVWSCLLESGHVCWSLVMSSGVWSCLLESGHVFWSLVMSSGVWSCLLESGHVFWSLVMSAGVWSCLLESGHVYWFLDMSSESGFMSAGVWSCLLVSWTCLLSLVMSAGVWSCLLESGHVFWSLVSVSGP
ncbi:hypothetical protein Btru_075882 [Bulinus truncatus]|nr:hypothetical protein Btru_075882 [Bulinus truncatus]